MPCVPSASSSAATCGQEFVIDFSYMMETIKKIKINFHDVVVKILFLFLYEECNEQFLPRHIESHFHRAPAMIVVHCVWAAATQHRT